jgi:hypothetical protein
MSEQEIVPVNNSVTLDPEIAKALSTWEDHLTYFSQFRTVFYCLYLGKSRPSYFSPWKIW